MEALRFQLNELSNKRGFEVVQRGGLKPFLSQQAV